MSCYAPLYRYRLDSGKLVGECPEAPGGEVLKIPCGRCVGCALERSKMWALRCRHEASCWDHNVFLTLTYDDEHGGSYRSLSKADLSGFIKRLRKRVEGVQAAPGASNRPVRYFACGEYGSKTFRPHYHVLLFNLRLQDTTVYGKDTYTSDLLSRLWRYGSHVCGAVTPASAAYTAGYASKKIGRRSVPDGVDTSTGECVPRISEFSLMSRRPGIGRYWYDKYSRDLRHGYCVSDGSKLPVPRFYADKYKESYPEDLEDREYSRYLRRAPVEEETWERLVVKEAVARARSRFFRRSSTMEG